MSWELLVCPYCCCGKTCWRRKWAGERIWTVSGNLGLANLKDKLNSISNSYLSEYSKLVSNLLHWHQSKTGFCILPMTVWPFPCSNSIQYQVLAEVPVTMHVSQQPCMGRAVLALALPVTTFLGIPVAWDISTTQNPCKDLSKLSIQVCRVSCPKQDFPVFAHS